MRDPRWEPSSTEKTSLTHAQNEDRDRGQRPQVGKEKVARLTDEPQQEDAKQRESDQSPSLYCPHRNNQDQRQQRQPLIRPNLVGDERSQRKPERHSVGGGHTPSPRRPPPSHRQTDRAPLV